MCVCITCTSFPLFAQNRLVHVDYIALQLPRTGPQCMPFRNATRNQCDEIVAFGENNRFKWNSIEYIADIVRGSATAECGNGEWKTQIQKKMRFYWFCGILRFEYLKRWWDLCAYLFLVHLTPKWIHNFSNPVNPIHELGLGATKKKWVKNWSNTAHEWCDRIKCC